MDNGTGSVVYAYLLNVVMSVIKAGSLLFFLACKWYHWLYYFAVYIYRKMAITKAVRERVYQKYQGRCAYCGNAINYKNMQVDHYLPKCKEKFYLKRCKKDVHGEDNLMPACRRCNHYKRARTLKQFRELLKTLHERVAAIYILKVAVDYGIANIKPFDGKFYFEKVQEALTCTTMVKTAVKGSAIKQNA